MVIHGINPVLEAIRARRVREIRIASAHNARVARVAEEAERAGVPVRRVSAHDLDRVAGGGRHQGVVAELLGDRLASLADLVAARDRRPPLVVVLDGVEDPHNLGAILRTADAAGVSGVVRQRRHAAPLGSGAAKASAGASAHVAVVDVVNVSRTLEELKAAGLWIVGLTAEASVPYTEIDFTLPTALVVGSEDRGLRRLVREHCDWLVSIPMAGHVASLNVSVASGVALYEAVRQRRARARPRPLETAAREGLRGGSGGSEQKAKTT
jgi:23S rRNA (guanosine2251-2'-O)-methyltransferase